jgi:arginyl-tRNA synthetase
MDMKSRIISLLENALASCRQKGLLAVDGLPFIEVELTKEPAHGDYASNVAMILASRAKKSPRLIADMLSKEISDPDRILEKIEIAGPGFMNFFIREGIWVTLLEAVHRLK